MKPQGPREKVLFPVTRQVGGEEPFTHETIIAARVSSSRDTLDRQSSSLRRPARSPFHYKHHEGEPAVRAQSEPCSRSPQGRRQICVSSPARHRSSSDGSLRRDTYPGPSH